MTRILDSAKTAWILLPSGKVFFQLPQVEL
jgi:hypothetical protein